MFVSSGDHNSSPKKLDSHVMHPSTFLKYDIKGSRRQPSPSHLQQSFFLYLGLRKLHHSSTFFLCIPSLKLPFFSPSLNQQTAPTQETKSVMPTGRNQFDYSNFNRLIQSLAAEAPESEESGNEEEDNTRRDYDSDFETRPSHRSNTPHLEGEENDSALEDLVASDADENGNLLGFIEPDSDSDRSSRDGEDSYDEGTAEETGSEGDEEPSPNRTRRWKDSRQKYSDKTTNNDKVKENPNRYPLEFETRVSGFAIEESPKQQKGQSINGFTDMPQSTSQNTEADERMIWKQQVDKRNRSIAKSKGATLAAKVPSQNPSPNTSIPSSEKEETPFFPVEHRPYRRNITHSPTPKPPDRIRGFSGRKGKWKSTGKGNSHISTLMLASKLASSKRIRKSRNPTVAIEDMAIQSLTATPSTKVNSLSPQASRFQRQSLHQNRQTEEDDPEENETPTPRPAGAVPAQNPTTGGGNTRDNGKGKQRALDPASKQEIETYMQNRIKEVCQFQFPSMLSFFFHMEY